MKKSEFEAALWATFGTRGPSVVSDLALGPLGGRTGAEALADGVRPELVWAAICDVNELGDDARWHHRRLPESGDRGRRTASGDGHRGT